MDFGAETLVLHLPESSPNDPILVQRQASRTDPFLHSTLSFAGTGKDRDGNPVMVNLVQTRVEESKPAFVLYGFVLARDVHYTIRSGASFAVSEDSKGTTGTILQDVVVERQSANNYDNEQELEDTEKDERVGLRRNLHESTGLQESTSLQFEPDSSSKHRFLRQTDSGASVIKVLVAFPIDIACRIATFGFKTDCDVHVPELQAVLASIAQLVVNLTNQAYENSEINLSMSLVGFRVVDNYKAHGKNSFRQLKDLKNARSFLSLRRARDHLNADFVAMISTIAESCGVAFVVGGRRALRTGHRAYSVINYRCIPNHSFTHEVAHNLGCHHNAESTHYRGGYAFGYRGEGFRTIMSYSCERSDSSDACPRIAYFSNPNVTYNGLPTGDAAYANNALWINTHRSLYPNYRVGCAGENSMLWFVCIAYRIVRQVMDFLTSPFI